MCLRNGGISLRRLMLLRNGGTQTQPFGQIGKPTALDHLHYVWTWIQYPPLDPFSKDFPWYMFGNHLWSIYYLFGFFNFSFCFCVSMCVWNACYVVKALWNILCVGQPLWDIWEMFKVIITHKLFKRTFTLEYHFFFWSNHSLLIQIKTEFSLLRQI